MEFNLFFGKQMPLNEKLISFLSLMLLCCGKFNPCVKENPGHAINQRD